MATKLKSLGEQLEELPETDTSPLAGLRAPFPPNQVSKLPKETGAQAKQRKADQDAGKWPPKCDTCGGYHHPKAVHLDYVGHAALTDRLLDTDLEWSWEPVGFTSEGLPALDRNGGLWIKLTVCGVTRYGYGAADGKSGGDAMKEMIGDALRNAAMRFGAALDLWHKGDLHADDTPHNDTTGEVTITQQQFEELEALREKAGINADRFCKRFQIDAIAMLPADKFDEAKAALANRVKEPANA
jgi:hypothetical protein